MLTGNTLFGNNTLGGAINVITNQPGDVLRARFDGAYAGPDNFKSISGSVSGPIVVGVLEARIGAAYHKQDGFEINDLAGGRQNPLEQKSVNGSVRLKPVDWAVFTMNANFDRVEGGFVPYWPSSGPTDYSLHGSTNERALARIDYKGVNLKGVFEAASLRTTITAIAAYNHKSLHSNGDADFSPIDLFRQQQINKLETKTGELRFDTKWSDSVSTLIGVFADRYDTHEVANTTIVPIALTLNASTTSFNKTKAIFGTVFVKIDPTFELAAGLRYDRQKLNSSGAQGSGVGYQASELDPRVTLTKHWGNDLMTYASVARGSRGGGQNGPGAPNPIYRGDFVWTYEVGTKFSALDRKLSLNLAAFYNDYHHYIGLNAIAPSTLVPGTFVAVNLNAGRVASYGLEAEGNWRLTDRLKVYGGATLLHARVTNGDEFEATTGFALPGKRIFFVPDWNGFIGTNYRMPISGDDELVFDANAVGKGSRTGASLDSGFAPVLKSYVLVNGSVAWQHNNYQIAFFTTNLFNARYVETYLDQSILAKAGVPPFIVNNLAIQGERRRIGVRAGVRF